VEIKIWNKKCFKTEIIDDFIFSDIFRYKVIDNVILQIDKNKIIIYKDNFDHRLSNKSLKFINKNDFNHKKIKGINNIDNAILIHSEFSNVYYHWIYDVLPQLKILEFKKNIDIISLPLVHNFQKDSLDIISKVNKVYSKVSLYKINCLHIPLPTTRNLIPANFVYDFLIQNFSISLNNKSKKHKLYISRSYNFKRSILNESQLIEFLISKDFKICSLETTPFNLQIELFKNASVIISAHGSGLSNIVFCDKDTKIIEFYGPGCGERCFAKISNFLNLSYIAIEINELSYKSIFHHLFYILFPRLNRYDFKVDLKNFKLNFNKFV
jgi:hypothetical protein